MTRIDLWPEQPAIQAGQIEIGFTLEHAQGTRTRGWYRLPSEHRAAITESCDPFVLAALFTAMGTSADLLVHGAVSPSLLRNLEEFQAIWHAWFPDRYQPVEILAETEQEAGRAAGSAAVMTFSGGLDSAFTAWRHRTGQAGRQTENLQAGVILHGFDLPLKSEKAFDHAYERAHIMLDSLGMETISMVNNLRGLGGVFADCHAAILVSCLSLLQKRFSVGLIADSREHLVLLYPWGLPYSSNALSDRFLSSDAFTIQHDGAGYWRLDKSRALSGWPEAMSNLRICLGHDPLLRVRNCCRCEKCIRTILTFRVLGLALPACFERDVSNRQILRMSYDNPMNFYYFGRLLEEARRQRIRASWVRALRLSILWNSLLLPFRRSEFFHRVYARLR